MVTMIAAVKIRNEGRLRVKAIIPTKYTQYFFLNSPHKATLIVKI